MEKPIFREKKLNELSSPEDLNEYLKVTSLSAWTIMAAVLFLLLGLLVWACAGTLETRAKGILEVKGDEAIVSVSSDRAKLVKEGNPVEVRGQQVSLSDVRMDEYGRCSGRVIVNLDEGKYECEVIVERISPISFLFH